MKKLGFLKLQSGNRKVKCRRGFICWAVILASLFVVLFLAPGHDWVDGSYYRFDSMTENPAAEDIAEAMKSAFGLSEEEACATVWKTADKDETMQLEKGTYRIKMYYDTTTDWTAWQVYSSTEMNSDGSSFVLYGSGTLAKTCDSIDVNNEPGLVNLTFTVPNDVTGVTIRFIYPESSFNIRYYTVSESADRDALGYFIFFAVVITLLFYLIGIRYAGADEENQKRRGVVWILAFTVFYLCIPYMNGYLLGHEDIKIHLLRVEGIYESLRDGVFPMWLNMRDNNTYGYAFPIMYPQVFLYIPALFRLAGMSLLNAYKLFCCLINTAVVLLSYISFRTLFGRRSSAVIASAGYSLGLYYLTNIYIRGAIGETLAMAFIPAFLVFLYEAIRGDERKWPYLVLSATGIMGSHVLTAYICAVIAAITFVCFLPRMISDRFGKRIFALLKTAASFLLLNLFFIVPFLAYRKEELYINRKLNEGSIRGFLSGATYFSQMFISFAVADGESEGLGKTGDMPLTIGTASLIALVSLFIVLIVFRKRICEDADLVKIRMISIFALGGAIVCLYMSSVWFPWDKLINVPVLKTMLSMQFPWRMLGPATGFTALAEGCLGYFLIFFLTHSEISEPAMQTEDVRPGQNNGQVLEQPEGQVPEQNTEQVPGQISGQIPGYIKYCISGYIRRYIPGIVSVLAVILFVLNSLYFIQNLNYSEAVPDKATAVNDILTDSLYLYGGADYEGAISAGNVVMSSVEGTKLYNFSKKQTEVSFEYELPDGGEDAVLRVPLLYYNGYKAYINGEPAELSHDENYVITVQADRPAGEVLVRFEAPRAWNLAYAISITSAILFAAGLIIRACQPHRRQNREIKRGSNQ